MMQKKSAKLGLLIIIFIMATIIFTALMSSFSLLFGNKKFDITQKHKYGLKVESQAIAEKISTPINITLYISQDLDVEYPELDLHRQNLIRLLEKYQAVSDGKIAITIKNPQPYSATEYEAKSLNIRAFPDSENTKNMYFGAVFSNSKGERYVIPYFSVQRENYTEYDISRILAKLNGYQQKNIGIVSFGGNISDWQIFKKLEEDYNIIFLSNKTVQIPSSIKTLLVYNPQQVDINFLYALDQYIMRGGNLILFIDPYAEVVAQKYPYTKQNKIRLLPLLQNWGIEMDENIVVADTTLSREEYQTALSNKTNPTYIHLKKAENMNIPETMGKPLPQISFLSAGALNVSTSKETPIEVLYTPIFTTSGQGQLVDAAHVKYEKTEDIYNHLQKNKQKYVLAYWLKGMFKSFFDKSIVEGASSNQGFPTYISGSIKPSNIVIIADSDFLADELWNATGYQKESKVYDQIASANNADFILSLIDNLSGNTELSKLHVNYLINDEKNISEQIYTQVFQNFQNEYREKENAIAQLQKDLSEFKNKLSNREVGMTLLKIQELDEYNRRQQKIAEELKALNYKIQQSSGQKVNEIILNNIIVFPLILLALAFIGTRIYMYHKRQKNIRIINE